MTKTLTIAYCEVCGMKYCPEVDQAEHNRRHRAAVKARDDLAFAGQGPGLLPTSYEQRELLKHIASSSGDPVFYLWADFARSLAGMDYDLERHPSWYDWVLHRIDMGRATPA